MTNPKEESGEKYLAKLLELVPSFPSLHSKKLKDHNVEELPYANGINMATNLFAIDNQGFFFMWHEGQKQLLVINLKKLKVTNAEVQVPSNICYF